jgi:hypothetical protein
MENRSKRDRGCTLPPYVRTFALCSVARVPRSSRRGTLPSSSQGRVSGRARTGQGVRRRIRWVRDRFLRRLQGAQARLGAGRPISSMHKVSWFVHSFVPRFSCRLVQITSRRGRRSQLRKFRAVCTLLYVRVIWASRRHVRVRVEAAGYGVERNA